MTHSDRIIAVLDPSAIYPVIVRDLFFWFAHYDLYTPKWSRHAFDEWKEAMQRKDVSPEEAEKRVRKADQAFPDALVQHYEGLMKHLSLPDEKDRHVLAAAIKIHAHIIVSNNITHFPKPILDTFGIKVKTADDFLGDIIESDSETAIQAFTDMVFHKNQSPFG
ncbi:PIN domain-containing protein [uncultured Proteiniphilum sp.]|uniref:PIN domain-containing protein n=1 Tax=uncultured Proteiniphilum sp. TaxID=497637 RepID=UPI00262FEDCB|nr:PIN domain-containing protein [uncultured Proteiniphilum sp.]